MARSTKMTVQEIPLGVSLVEDCNDGFVLHDRKANGESNEIHLSEREFWGLRGAIAFFAHRILSRRQAPASGFETVIAQSVARAAVLPDAMQESVLLRVTAPTGEELTLQLPPHVAKLIADQIPVTLSEMSVGTWN
jgi:hypothetical protein